MNDDAIIFKPITVADVAQLSAVALQAYRGYYLHLWHDGGELYMQKSFSINALSAEIEDNNARFFIVYVNDLPVGFIKVNINAPLQEDTTGLELERIYFIKEASGKGYGIKAMEFVFSLAKALGKKMVWLKVMDSSAAAITFYTKLGFEICGTYRFEFAPMKEELRGMYVMKKYLNN